MAPAATSLSLRRVVVAALLVSTLAACGGADAPASQALRPVGEEHDVCTPSDDASAFTEGFDLFANADPVTVTDVDWPVTGDLAVASVRVLRRGPGDAFGTLGVWAGLPQDGLTGRYLRAWRRGVPAEGARLAPVDGRESYGVLAVGLTGTRGTGGPLRVRYVDADGVTGTAVSRVRLTVADRCTGG